MNYDDWKLSNPIDDSNCFMVSDCCGKSFDDDFICENCGRECNEIEDYEFKAIERENYLEDMRNE